MRKTSLLFLLFIEIAGLFLVFNLNQLFVQLGRAERERIKSQARQMASLSSETDREMVDKLKNLHFFSSVEITRGESGERENKDAEPPEFILRSQMKNDAILKLTVPLQSPALSTIGAIQSVSTGIIIVGGLFLVITAGILIAQIKKANKPSAGSIPIDPLQDYLLNLKGKEIRMKEEMTVQRQTAEQKESLTGFILNQVHFAVITLGKGKRIELFNRRAEQIFGRSYASVVNRPLSEALMAFPDFISFIQQRGVREASAELSAGDQTLSCKTMPLPHEGVLITIEDITSAREDRRREMERNSMLQLGEMAAYLSHEVRNSLGVIFGYTRTLKEDNPKIALINREIHFLSEMMERFLGFSKPTEPPKQMECNIADLIREVSEHTGIRLIQQNEALSQALADANLLKNVFDNLIRNAVQAGATELECHYSRERRFLEILLRDNGQGIPEELREKIWFPFFTTREKGNGMGLALVKKLMIAMGGEIHLQSGGIKETSFLLKLPLNQA